MATPVTTPQAKIINGTKTFIPLGIYSPAHFRLTDHLPENNPSSLSLLASNLGLKNISFHEIYSLDPIIQDLPRPVHALIFIAPAPVYHRVRQEEVHLFGPQAQATPPFALSGSNQPVVWFKQTIGHACGLIALLHAIANGEGTRCLSPDSPLAKLLAQAQDLNTEDRAELLYSSTSLEQAHMSAAVQGSTTPPDPSEPNGMHFICFVKTESGRIWDLEGGWSGPVPRCELSADEDLVSEKAIKDGPGRYLDVGREMGIAEFSCVAVVLDEEGTEEKEDPEA